MITRRTFVGVLSAFTAAGALGVGLSGSRRHLAIGGIRSGVLAPLQGRTVFLRGPDGTTSRAVVDRVSVSRQPARPGAPGTEQISMLFDTDGEAGPYRIENADLVLSELHLTPVNLPGRDRRLEAVITRIV